MEMALFVVLALVAVAAGVGVVGQRNVVRSALFLLVAMCCLAGLYILLNAQFIAMVQLIVYAGAVVVLFLFVVMLLGIERSVEPDPPAPGLARGLWIAGALLGALFLAGVVWAVVSTPWTAAALSRSGDVRQIGAALLTDFAIPFEMASVLLLVAIIGALVLAKRKLEE